ncbi:protein prenyltransferase alpha subunit repeat-containing protein 1 [Xiphophorus maculatus]|uniref:Protein prenyltransferase alpha subunit repeat containing 1 n=1 Tax=Xiphophorus maculatus TaxID=8083 RepID=M4AUS5_XIPMA|nr:protein prenyltransferase alpha subunit repeat-containing protein 1 [Xiphophorus maculatus]
MAESKEEVDVLVQRVVKDISIALKRHPNIDEIGLIQCPEARYNRSPIVLVENKLGVESWCVKFMLPYVHNKLLLYRQRKHWLDREALVDITCTLLLLNPDFTTAWNVRKELLECGALNPERDLYLSKLALTKFPKSPETWIHRRWVLQHILRQFSAVAHKTQQRVEAEQPDAERSQFLGSHLDRLIHQEMKVCSDAACRYPSNYNAWSHRIWVLQHMAKGNIKVFRDELSSVHPWVSMHVSDHSGFHYRQFLLKELLNTELSQSLSSDSASTVFCPSQHQSNTVHSTCPQANGELSLADAACRDRLTTVFKLFYQETELCADLIQSFPGHETLWSHRRHVYYLWHHWRQDQDLCTDGRENELKPTCINEPDGSQGRSVNRHKHVSVPMEVDRVSLPDHDSKRLRRGILLPNLLTLQNEHTFVNSILNSCCNAEQNNYAVAYKKWLDTVISAQSLDI